MKITAARGGVVGSFTVTDDDEILVFSSGGNIIRMPASDVSTQGRDATGVRVARLGDGETIVASPQYSRANRRRGRLRPTRSGRAWSTTPCPATSVASPRRGAAGGPCRRRPQQPAAAANGRRRRKVADGDGVRRPLAPEPTPAPVAAARGPTSGRARAGDRVRSPVRRAHERRFRQTLMKVDLWSVPKLALCFYVSAMFVTIVAMIALWMIADAAGIVGSVEKFLGDLLSAKDFKFLSGEVLRGTIVVGLVVVALQVVITVIAASFYNIFAELFGGLEIASRKTSASRSTRVVRLAAPGAIAQPVRAHP